MKKGWHLLVTITLCHRLNHCSNDRVRDILQKQAGYDKVRAIGKEGIHLATAEGSVDHFTFL